MIRRQAGDAVFGSWADVDPVKAAAAHIRNGLVAVGFGVPRVATVFLLSKSLPYVTHAGRQTHLGHLGRGQRSRYIQTQLPTLGEFGRLASGSLKFVSPPNRTVTSSGASFILCITTRSCFIRSTAWPLQLSR